MGSLIHKYKKQEETRKKFRTVVSEVSSFAGNPDIIIFDYQGKLSL